jgi:hypothetical protein
VAGLHAQAAAGAFMVVVVEVFESLIIFFLVQLNGCSIQPPFSYASDVPPPTRNELRVGPPDFIGEF